MDTIPKDRKQMEDYDVFKRDLKEEFRHVDADGKEGPDIKGATAKEWSVNAMVLVPIFAFYCYWKHDKLMQSDWWLWYQILFSWGASVYAGLRAKVDGFVAEKEVLTSVVAGFAFLIGLFLAYRRMKNKAYKMTLANALQTEPGFSYVKTVLGQLPAYLSMRGETDTVEWLNLLVADLFPSLSGMLAQIMSYAVEPVLEYYKPPGIKSMTFQRFTLGTQPMRFTGAKAGKFTRNAKDHVYVDLDFAFDSDAEIQFVVTIGKVKSIAIVKDLKLHGTVRILLQPFHDQIPTFKAFSISFVGAPYVHMHTGSKGMPLPNFVLRFLSNFITDMVLNWFVWPLRIGPIVMATGVNYYDIDRRPTAVVLTRLQQVVQVNRSRIDPNKMYRLAVWAGNAAQKSYTSVDYIRGDRLVFGGNKRGAGERFELVLKEPEIETIKIALEQIEGSFGSKPDTEEIARYEVKIRDVIQDNPDEKEDFEINYRVPLTTADMGSRGGEVVGKLEMGMILNPQKSGLDSDVGSVYVKVVTIAGIPRTDLAGWADPYFKILIADKHGTKEVHRSPVRKCRDDRALTWFLEESTAMQIRIRDSKDAPIDPTSRIILELYDDDPFKDQLIGKFEMTMTDLVEQHAGFVTDKFTFYGECEAKLQEWPPSEDKRKWTDSWYKPYEREYVPVQGKPNMMQCKLELEAIFSWLGYH